MVLLTGPTERQVREIVMGEVSRAFHRARDLPGELYRLALRLEGDEARGILAFTSSEASRLTGFHAPHVLAIITEAQGVEDFAFEGMMACTTGERDRLLAVGNPLNPSGKFYEVSKADHWRSFQISADDHPNITGDSPHIPGGVSKAFGERLVQEYGAGSGIVQSRWYGEFPDQGEEAMFARSDLEATAERWPAGLGELTWLANRNALPEPVAAVDPARFGPDSTVLGVRLGKTLTKLVSWKGCNLMETVQRIREEVARDGVRPWTEYGDAWGDLVVDSVGLGAGVADRLSERGYQVSEYNGGFQPGRRDRFFNGWAESYWNLRTLLEAGEIARPRVEVLFDELLSITWRLTPSGQVQLESKQDLKRRLGRSPDRADGASMAFCPRAIRTTVITEYRV